MYADKDFYQNTFFGRLIPEAELDSALARASENIDQLTFFRINKKGGLEGLTTFQAKLVKLAVCAQADFVHGLTEMPEWIQSYSIGSASVTKADGVSTSYSTKAVEYLTGTNLLYKGLW